MKNLHTRIQTIMNDLADLKQLAAETGAPSALLTNLTAAECRLAAASADTGCRAARTCPAYPFVVINNDDDINITGSAPGILTVLGQMARP